MKHLFYSILSIILLYQTGCSSDEPQSVVFDINKMHISSNKQDIRIGITANCPWTIRTNGDKLSIPLNSGEGTTNTSVSVTDNTTHDVLDYTLIVVSEDRTSSDTLTITQDCIYEMFVQNLDPIPCEGGTYDLSTTTNDKIIQIEKPEWITISSSRGLSQLTYSIDVEPNRTGSPRKDKILFKGENTNGSIAISQDSYYPDKIITDTESAYIDGNYLYVPYSLEPEYADWTKIEVSSTAGNLVGNDKSTIAIRLYDFGEYCYSVYSDGVELVCDTFLIVPEKALIQPHRPIFYVGQSLPLEFAQKSYNYVFTSSEPNVVSVSSDGLMDMLSPGTAYIYASIPKTEFSDSIKIEVKDVVITAWKTFLYSNFGEHVLNLKAVVEGKNITHYKIATIDYNQGIVIPQCVKEGTLKNGSCKLVYETSAVIRMNNYDDVIKGLKNIKVEFAGIVNGAEQSGATSVLRDKPDWVSE